MPNLTQRERAEIMLEALTIIYEADGIDLDGICSDDTGETVARIAEGFGVPVWEILHRIGQGCDPDAERAAEWLAWLRERPAEVEG